MRLCSLALVRFISPPDLSDQGLSISTALFGWFADRCQHRRFPFVLGLIALGASTLLFVVARSPGVLIIARSLQGLSAAAVWVVGLAIIADNVPQERVGEAMGQTTIALTWGFLLGPIAGGIMFEKVGFYATFIVPTAFIVLEVILRLAMLEVPSKYRQKSLRYCKLLTRLQSPFKTKTPCDRKTFVLHLVVTTHFLAQHPGKPKLPERSMISTSKHPY